jgi:hypothetical protein
LTNYRTKNFNKTRKDETLNIAAVTQCCFNECYGAMAYVRYGLGQIDIGEKAGFL